MSYNLSLINGTGILPLAQSVNDNLMFGYLGIGFILTFVTMAFLAFNQRSEQPKRSAASAFLLGAIVALPLMALGLLSDIAIFIVWALFGVSIFLMFLKD